MDGRGLGAIPAAQVQLGIGPEMIQETPETQETPGIRERTGMDGGSLRGIKLGPGILRLRGGGPRTSRLEGRRLGR